MTETERHGYRRQGPQIFCSKHFLRQRLRPPEHFETNHGIRIDRVEERQQAIAKTPPAQPFDSDLEVYHRPAGQFAKPPAVETTAKVGALEGQDHVPLRFVALGVTGSLDRAGIEHRSRERPTGEIVGQDLSAVNVACEHRRETGRNVSASNDIDAFAKGVAGRSDPGSLHRLVKAQEANRSRPIKAPRLAEEPREPLPDVLPLIGEAGDHDVLAADLELDRARSIQQVDASMSRQKRIGNRRSLVVARHDDDRNTVRRDLDQRLEGAVDQLAPDSAAKQEIASVDHQIDLAAARRFQGAVEVGEKIRAAPAALDTGPLRKIEAEVGVGDQ